MFVTKSLSVVTIIASLLFWSAQAHADDPDIESVEVTTDDETVSFSLGLDAQLRYSLSGPDDASPTSEFALRRFRPILGFEAFDDFEAKLVPEFAGQPELKDGVVGWSPSSGFSLEAGQFAPPFNWERDGSSDYHQFTERSVANSEFQIADGRDIGLQFDWELEKLLDVEAGFFNGAGSNTSVTPGAGHLITGRVAYAPLGAYHEVEVVPFVVERAVLMFGVGGYFAFENAWRDWSSPGLQPDTQATEARGDVWSVTADAHAWFWRFSLHAQGFFREVRPGCDMGLGCDTYSGAGFTGQAGFLVVDELMLVAFRYSLAEPDRRYSLDSHEVATAIQLFHRGNRSKFTIDAGLVERPTGQVRYGRLQYQILL